MKKIKKSVIEELIERRKRWSDLPFLSPQSDKVYDAIYDFAYEESIRLQVEGTTIWDLLEVASVFDKLNVKTVTALFVALGVGVYDD